MKKIFGLLMIIFVLTILVGCEIPQAELYKVFGGNESEIIDTIGPSEQTNYFFLPSEESTLQHKNGLKEEVVEYYEKKGYENVQIALGENVFPIKLFGKAEIDAFVSNIGNESDFFIYYQGELYNVGGITFNTSTNHSFVHFGITDINEDGYIEILVSTNINKEEEKGHYSFTYVSIIDTKSKEMIQLDPIYERFAYFKEDQNVVGVYQSDNETINNGTYEDANTLVTTLEKNTYKFNFLQKEYQLNCGIFKAEVSIDKELSNFPIITTSSALYFEVEVDMTYLGETFTYTSSDTYLDGATCSFVHQSDKNCIISYEGIIAGQAITDFTITTGMEIDRTYKFNFGAANELKAGTYDMIISYKEVSFPVTGFLTITK